MNGTVTKSLVNKRFRMGVDINIAVRLPVRGPNTPNFRDEKDKSLKGYKKKYLENIRQFQQFTKNDNIFSTSPHVASRKYPKRIWKSTARLIDNQLNETNFRAIVGPSIENVIYRHDCSVSVMIIEPTQNIFTASHYSNAIRRTRKRDVLTKKT